MVRPVARFLALVAGLVLLPEVAAATVLGDPTLSVGAGRFALAGEVDLGLDNDFETNRLWLRGDYGLAPNIDGFLRLGLFDGDTDGGFGGDASLDGFGFGGGARADLLQEKDWHIGGLVQMMYNMGEAEVTTPAIPPFIPAMTFKEDVDWLEIDVAGAASFRGAGPFIPYAGVRLGLITGDPDTDFGVTLFGGASYAITEQLLVGAELRIIDDAAIGAFVRYRF